MEIKKVGVAGCGLMGHGIAQVSAEAGFDVVVSEVSQETLDKGIGKIEKQLARAVEKGKAEQAEADAVLGRIHGTLDLADFADCDLVIEAVTEDLPTKLELWKELDGIVGEQALFASNTRLGIAASDIYFIHTPVHPMPLEHWVAAAAKEANRGNARSLGLSNCDAEQVCDRLKLLLPPLAFRL